MSVTKCAVFLVFTATFTFTVSVENPAARSHAVRQESSESIIVTSIEVAPFLVRVSGNTSSDEFKGFIPDLLKPLARLLGFDYEIRLVRDGKYGSKHPNGTWDGMIGELTRREADLAAAPLVVTSMRERVIESIKPFMNNYLAAIMKTSHATQFEIRSVSDLARQSTVKYGVVESGSTKTFFTTSRIREYELMWGEMYNNPDSMVQTYEQGVERVLASTDQQPFAFIGTSSMLTYIASQRCDVQVVIDEYVSQPYAFAVPIGSPYTNHLNLAILQMHEDGKISQLRQKWWRPQMQCGN